MLTVRREARGKPRITQIEKAYWEGYEDGLASLAQSIQITIDATQRNGLANAQRSIAQAEKEEKERGPA